ncbi:MAG: SDR family oxidoreductase [Bdellovibrionales bacterium]
MENYKSLFDLSKKTILVTGATGFLGKNFVLALSQHGAKTLIVDRQEEDCERLAKELKSQGLQAEACPVNLKNLTEIQAWSKDLLQKHGPIDVLVNNAAVKPKGFFDPFESYTLETLREVMQINFEAPVVMSQIFGGLMAKRGHGVIVNMGSIYGFTAPDQRIYEGSWHEKVNGPLNTPVSYAVSKAAVHQLTKYLSTLWGAQGVRVNTLSPGGVSEGQNGPFQEKYSQKVPLGRMAKVNEIVGPMVFLCSDAADYITGQNLLVDGGWSVW